jgi:hypothetical protein
MPLLIQCYKMLMLSICDEEVQMHHSNFENEDLFQTIENNVEVLAQLVAWELDTFQWYHVDVDRCKCALFWWHA